MTNQEFVDKLGLHCPFCNNPEHVEMEGIDFPDNGIITCNSSCGSCGNKWKEIYTLTEYEKR